MPLDDDRAIGELANAEAVERLMQAADLGQPSGLDGHAPGEELGGDRVSRDERHVELGFVSPEPLANPVLERQVVAVGAKREAVETTPGCQVAREPFDGAPRDLLAVETAVLIHDSLAHRGHVGRVNRDAVEHEPRDRHVEVALERGDVLQPVEPTVELGETGGPLGDVHGPGLLRPARRRRECRHPRTGAQVEKALARFAGQEVQEALRVVGQCGEHDVVVFVHRSAIRVRWPIGGDHDRPARIEHHRGGPQLAIVRCRDHETERPETLAGGGREQRDDLGAGRILPVQKEMGQETEGIVERVRGCPALAEGLEV